jgi:hypothetical protein
MGIMAAGLIFEEAALEEDEIRGQILLDAFTL